MGRIRKKHSFQVTFREVKRVERDGKKNEKIRYRLRLWEKLILLISKRF